MNKLTVIYKPYKWIFWKTTATGSHPENWQEVSPKQLIAIATTYKGNISDVNFIHIMTGIKKSVIKKLDPYQHYEIIKLMDFINDLKPFNSFIIRYFIFNGHFHFAPQPNLKNMTFGQFIFADSFFSNYNASGQETDLNKFIASLYIPPYVKFSESCIEKYSPLTAKLDIVTKEAIIINYLLIKEWLTISYPLLFYKSEKKDNSKKTNNIKNNNHDSMQWVKVLESVIGDDIANHDKYADLSLHNMLRYLTKKLKENMKRK